jgi:ligand-binding sensor domain-containing protein
VRRAIGFSALSLAMALTPLVTPAHGGTWVTHLYMNNIRDLAVTEAGVWCATGGGALFYDVSLGEFQAWNRAPDELASDTLTSVAALSDGRIAFGTDREGLSLYDPRSGLWFSETVLTSSQIVGDAILFIGEAPPWRIIGSRGVGDLHGGFVAQRDGAVRELCEQSLETCGLPGWDVAAAIEHDGALWFGTRPGVGSIGGVGRLSGGVWDTLNVGLPSLSVVGFAVWGDSLFCGTRAGVVVRDGEGWVRRGDGLPASATVCALRAGPTRLLLAASGTAGGVFSWNDATRSWDRLGTLQARCVAEGADGIVWAGASAEASGRSFLESEEDGLWEYVGGEWIQHRHAGPHPVGAYTALAPDGSGRLWAATAGRGLGWRIARYDHAAWDFFDSGDVPGFNNTWVFDLRPSGDQLFVGHCCCSNPDTPCYLNVWNPGSNAVAVYDSVYNIQDSDVDDAGRIWLASLYEAAVGLAARGIYRYDPSTGAWVHLTNESTGGRLLSNKVAAVEVASGYLWIGYHSEGLSRCVLGADGLPIMEDAKWEHFTADSTTSPLLSNGVRALASRAGQVWIGTTGGVTLWRPNGWRLFRPSAAGLPGSDVSDIALTDDGAAWIGIRGTGVTRITQDTGGTFAFDRIYPPDLVSPAVTVMATAGDGRGVWVGTDAGLSQYLPVGSTESSAAAEVRVYPNPFNPVCSKPLRLLRLPGRAVEGTICNAAGKTLAQFKDAWEGDAIWDGRDAEGRPAAPGLYLIRVSTPRGWLTGRVAVLDLPCAE